MLCESYNRDRDSEQHSTEPAGGLKYIFVISISQANPSLVLVPAKAAETSKLGSSAWDIRASVEGLAFYVWRVLTRRTFVQTKVNTRRV